MFASRNAMSKYNSSLHDATEFKIIPFYSDYGVGYLGYILGRGTIFSLCFKVQAGSVYQPLFYPMRRFGT